MKNSIYLVDGWNNNKVVGCFRNMEAAKDYLGKKEFTENWENTTPDFSEFLDGFIFVKEADMNAATRLFGKRRLQYWT